MSTPTMLNLGTPCGPSGTPACESSGHPLGSGPYPSPVAGWFESLIRLQDGCTFRLEVSSTVNVIDDRNATMDVVHSESDFSSSCTAVDTPAVGSCTTRYGMHISM